MRTYYVIFSPIFFWLWLCLFAHAAFGGFPGITITVFTGTVCCGLMIIVPISDIILGRSVLRDLWCFLKDYGFIKSFTLLAVLIDIIIVCIVGYILLDGLLFKIASIF
ncbi:MAG: hypothetical protein LBP87_00680 [Planctomycetaceae bacterium]|jgi:hypothetical protein|nr:hypothetical protein [Planctomycetaceae bacterium]